MNRIARWAVPLAVLACAFAGAGQQRKTRGAASSAPEPVPQSPYTEAIRDNNLGLALMDRMDFENALGRFQVACILDPQSDAGCLNMGIALLNLGRYEQARTILAKSAGLDPSNPRAWFNLGLVERAEGQSSAAAADLEKVKALDPNDATTFYMLATIDSDAQQDDPAAMAFEDAIRLDRFNTSAELGLAQVLERTGDTDGALQHLDRFRHLLSSNLGHSVSSTYGEQGKYSLAEELMVSPGVGGAIPVRFVDVTASAGLPTHFAEANGSPGAARATRNGRKGVANPGAPAEDLATGKASQSLAGFLGSGACVFDFDGDGKPDVLLVDGDGRGDAALYRNAGRGRFVNVTKSAGLVFHGEGTGCATGDYNNDGRIDLALSSSDGVRLYENQGNGKFKDVTSAAGLHVDGLAMGLTFVDIDRDGYLDLYVTRFDDFPLGDSASPFEFPKDAPPPGNMLWRNTGRGTFVDATKEAALGGSEPSVGAIGADIDNDGAVDFVVTGIGQAPLVLLNKREGVFEGMNPWGSEMPGPTAGVAALDFDKDGWMDFAFTHWGKTGLSLWRNVGGKTFERAMLPDPGWMRGWGISPIDYDNDGWVDLVAVGETFAGEGRILLLRNEGEHGFRDVTQETGLDKIKLHNPRGVIACDFDGDGGTDLLITQNRLPAVLLKNTGGNQNGWLELGLKRANGNREGVGAEVGVFDGDQRQRWDVPGASGYLGAAPAEIHMGLGAYGDADIVHILWPDGKAQTEMQVRGDQRTVISQRENRSTATPSTTR